MWVINPEGLLDSGKVIAVISSAFGSQIKKIRKKLLKRERQTEVRQ